jgi:TrmH family RNA methyltransferase
VPPAISPLTRAQTTRIRELLRDKHVRQAEGTFIVEGAKAVLDILRNHSSLVRCLVTTPGYRAGEHHNDRRLRESVPCPSFSSSDHTFAAMSDLDTPQGILAVVTQPAWKEEDVLSQRTIFGIYGERIQDPLNVGTMIRTAAALNVTALWLTPDSADRFNPKVVRATSGSLLSLPIFSADDISELVRRGCSVFAAEVNGPETVSLDKINHIPKRVILAVGSEGHGLSMKTKKQAVCRLTIPLSRCVESLNVATTTAIAAHYLGLLPRK